MLMQNSLINKKNKLNVNNQLINAPQITVTSEMIKSNVMSSVK